MTLMDPSLATHGTSVMIRPLFTSSDPITYHTYKVEGNYIAMLTVTDNDGLKNTAQKTLIIIEHPVARFTYSPAYPIVREPVNFDASASTPMAGASLPMSGISETAKKSVQQFRLRSMCTRELELIR